MLKRGKKNKKEKVTMLNQNQNALYDKFWITQFS